MKFRITKFVLIGIIILSSGILVGSGYSFAQRTIDEIQFLWQIATAITLILSAVEGILCISLFEENDNLKNIYKGLMKKLDENVTVEEVTVLYPTEEFKFTNI